MRHTVHLLLGDALKSVGEALKDYVLKYGEGEMQAFAEKLSARLAADLAGESGK